MWQKYRGPCPSRFQQAWASGFLISSPSSTDAHPMLRITVVKDRNWVSYSDTTIRASLSFSQYLHLSVSVSLSLPSLLFHGMVKATKNSEATSSQLIETSEKCLWTPVHRQRLSKGIRSIWVPASIIQSSRRRLWLVHPESHTYP